MATEQAAFDGGDGLSLQIPAVGARTGATYTLGVRPSAVRINWDEPAADVDAARLKVRVIGVELLGECMDVTVRCGRHTLTARTATRRGVAIGHSVSVGLHPRDVHVFEDGPDGRRLPTTPRTTAVPGAHTTLVGSLAGV